MQVRRGRSLRQQLLQQRRLTARARRPARLRLITVRRLRRARLRSIRGALLRLPRACRRRGPASQCGTAATYVRTHVYNGTGHYGLTARSLVCERFITLLIQTIYLYKVVKEQTVSILKSFQMSQHSHRTLIMIAFSCRHS